MEINKIQYRVVIHFLTSKEHTAKKIHQSLLNFMGDNAPSETTVRFYIGGFKPGKEGYQDDPRPGRPKSATDDETVLEIQKTVDFDRRKKVFVIAQKLDIAKTIVHRFVIEVLNMKKNCARWVIKILTLCENG
jgi:HTH domain in Mos1 transposase